MNVGIPGTGIGGLFYIAAALLAPLRRSGRRRGAFWLAAMGAAVLVGIFATGWLLGLLIGPGAKPMLVAGPPAFYRPETENIVRWAALLGSMLLLGTVLLSVQAARLVRKLRWKK